jgi:hypothetical protein
LVEAVCREAVQLALACADGTCATQGIEIVKAMGMLPVIQKNIKIQSIVFSSYSPSFTDVRVLFGKVGEKELHLYFSYEGGHLARATPGHSQINEAQLWLSLVTARPARVLISNKILARPERFDPAATLPRQ